LDADYREESGLDAVDAKLVLPLILITSLFELPGSILGGWGADRYGRRTTIITMYTIAVFAAVLCSFAVYAELHWAFFLVCVCIIKASMRARHLPMPPLRLPSQRHASNATPPKRILRLPRARHVYALTTVTVRTASQLEA